jgi:hypothetical protein
MPACQRSPRSSTAYGTVGSAKASFICSPRPALAQPPPPLPSPPPAVRPVAPAALIPGSTRCRLHGNQRGWGGSAHPGPSTAAVQQLAQHGGAAPAGHGERQQAPRQQHLGRHGAWHRQPGLQLHLPRHLGQIVHGACHQEHHLHAGGGGRGGRQRDGWIAATARRHDPPPPPPPRPPRPPHPTPTHAPQPPLTSRLRSARMSRIRSRL